MKRHGNLWQKVISFVALLRAADKARKGKRFRPAVALFHFDQERALLRLHEELATKTYRPGAYRSFFIHEPKSRRWMMRLVGFAAATAASAWTTPGSCRRRSTTGVPRSSIRVLFVGR